MHPIYPILSQSKARLNSRLANCPSSLRNAFHEALYAAVHSFTSLTTASHENPNSKRAANLLIAATFNSPFNQPLSTSLVHLQALILLAIEADYRSPAALRSPRSVSLGSAIGLAYALKLHVHSDKVSDDPDSDENLGRRIWWSLVIMDRWHASSTSSPLLIPDGSVVVYPEDQALLGDSLYHLARRSCY